VLLAFWFCIFVYVANCVCLQFKVAKKAISGIHCCTLAFRKLAKNR